MDFPDLSFPDAYYFDSYSITRAQLIFCQSLNIVLLMGN